MTQDFSIVPLVLHASLVVQIVMFGCCSPRSRAGR
jgi:hypothetical protein